MDIPTELRKQYTKNGLRRKDLNPSPFLQFDLWLQQAIDAKVIEPNAMALATMNTEDIPSLRTVLLKDNSEEGFVFYTNYDSPKAKEIDSNPNVALLFLWLPLERQLKITGIAEKTPPTESEEYFKSRPKGNQLSAWTSPQSTVIDSRKVLEEQYKAMEQKFSGQSVPAPPLWGGYRVKPSSFEFWQGQPDRLHDRFLYKKSGNSWFIHRLAP